MENGRCKPETINLNFMNKLKVMTFIGTRPEIIRLSRIMARLDEHLDHIIVHTGQNYDYELNEIFFRDLELRKPDYFLGVDTSSLEASVGDIIRRSGDVLRKVKPDAVLVLGDTNSCLAAYMAKRLHIPVFHMEAGNRCYDFNVPEEINRRIIDHIADFNLVYTEHARTAPDLGRVATKEDLPYRKSNEGGAVALHAENQAVKSTRRPFPETGTLFYCLNSPGRKRG